MKRFILILICILVSSVAYAKFESSSRDAASVVLYGKTSGGVLVPIEVDGSGNVSTSGGGIQSCLMLRDTDDAGWTEVTSLDGVLTASTDAELVCDVS